MESQIARRILCVRACLTEICNRSDDKSRFPVQELIHAYRVRGQIDADPSPRVGLKGTAKISGRWTVLSYWILRRPLAVIRTTLGI